MLEYNNNLSNCDILLAHGLNPADTGDGISSNYIKMMIMTKIKIYLLYNYRYASVGRKIKKKVLLVFLCHTSCL